jgi:hypothetical protein
LKGGFLSLHFIPFSKIILPIFPFLLFGEICSPFSIFSNGYWKEKMEIDQGAFKILHLKKIFRKEVSF